MTIAESEPTCTLLARSAVNMIHDNTWGTVTNFLQDGDTAIMAAVKNVSSKLVKKLSRLLRVVEYEQMSILGVTDSASPCVLVETTHPYRKFESAVTMLTWPSLEARVVAETWRQRFFATLPVGSGCTGVKCTDTQKSVQGSSFSLNCHLSSQSNQRTQLVLHKISEDSSSGWHSKETGDALCVFCHSSPAAHSGRHVVIGKRDEFIPILMW